jgi:hypothetical protein
LAKDALKLVGQVAGAARTEHYRLTLPWTDEGFRILSSAGYFQYTEAIRKLKSDYENAVQVFIGDYPSLIADARVRLNGMFNDADYPEVKALPKLFAFETAVRPMPDANDFRASLGDAEVQILKGRIQADMDRAMGAAMRDVWTRLKTVVSAMVERLGQADGIFRDSLVDNVRELLEIVPILNVMGDRNITMLASEIRDKLTQYNPDTLRENTVVRTAVATSAQDILDKMGAYL